MTNAVKKKSTGCYESVEEKKHSNWTLRDNRQVVKSNDRQESCSHLDDVRGTWLFQEVSMKSLGKPAGSSAGSRILLRA